VLPALDHRLADGRAISFAEYVEIALYDHDHGFYATGGRAGGRGDFLTSPEVGPLFGALLARVCDEVWEQLGRPDPFVVVDAGAGPGTLARTVRAAAPACAASLVYVMVERSASQRAGHAEHLPGWVGERSGAALDALATTPLDGAGPRFASSAALPSSVGGVIIANELLDNLPFDVVRRTPGGAEQLEVVRAGDGLELVSGPATVPVARGLVAVGAPEGEWVPWQGEAASWVGEALGRLRGGRLVVIDYGAPTAELARRPELGWLRTFRGNERGSHPLDAPGAQDITADVAVDQLQLDHPAARVRSQADLLRQLGLDELVQQGRRVWDERAHAPDVVALRARSRIREAEALTDPSGLGAFVVLEWDVGLPSAAPDPGGDTVVRR
jgi:SAM-dependent MidA family methyltransferase